MITVTLTGLDCLRRHFPLSLTSITVTLTGLECLRRNFPLTLTTVTLTSYRTGLYETMSTQASDLLPA